MRRHQAAPDAEEPPKPWGRPGAVVTNWRTLAAARRRANAEASRRVRGGTQLPISRRVVLYRESRRRRPLAAGILRACSVLMRCRTTTPTSRLSRWSSSASRLTLRPHAPSRSTTSCGISPTRYQAARLSRQTRFRSCARRWLRTRVTGYGGSMNPMAGSRVCHGVVAAGRSIRPRVRRQLPRLDGRAVHAWRLPPGVLSAELSILRCVVLRRPSGGRGVPGSGNRCAPCLWPLAVGRRYWCRKTIRDMVSSTGPA
jgi:hypothetical protein